MVFLFQSKHHTHVKNEMGEQTYAEQSRARRFPQESSIDADITQSDSSQLTAFLVSPWAIKPNIQSTTRTTGNHTQSFTLGRKRSPESAIFICQASQAIVAALL